MPRMVDHQGLEGRLEKRKYPGNGGLSALFKVGNTQKLPKINITFLYVKRIFFKKYLLREKGCSQIRMPLTSLILPITVS